MMRTTLALIVSASAMAAPAQPRENRVERTIAEKLQGRVPGPPQTCITQSRTRGSTHTGNVVLIEDTAGVLYLSNFRNGCRLRSSDALILRTTSPQLCSGEIVEGRDLQAGVSTMSCSYGDFVPYRKPR